MYLGFLKERDGIRSDLYKLQVWEDLVEQHKGISSSDHGGMGSSPGLDELLYGGVCIIQTPYKLNGTEVYVLQPNSTAV